jgi:hypothetical protein
VTGGAEAAASNALLQSGNGPARQQPRFFTKRTATRNTGNLFHGSIDPHPRMENDMKLPHLLIAALALAPLPLAAQSLHDTHEMRWAPAGKTPTATWHYRGKNHRQTADACHAAAAPVHLSGKTVMHTAMHTAPAGRTDCGTRVALKRQDATIARD